MSNIKNVANAKQLKKKHRKTSRLAKKNYRGGYVYTVSKALDKSSSIISQSSFANSNTENNKHHRKTRRTRRTTL